MNRSQSLLCLLIAGFSLASCQTSRTHSTNEDMDSAGEGARKILLPESKEQVDRMLQYLRGARPVEVTSGLPADLHRMLTLDDPDAKVRRRSFRLDRTETMSHPGKTLGISAAGEYIMGRIGDGPLDVHLPTTSERALAMPRGSFVSFPLEGRLWFDLMNSQSRELLALDKSLPLKSHVTAYGTLSGSLTGHLLAEGRWTVNVIRKKESWVRVRISSDKQFAARASAQASVSGFARAWFIPATQLQQVRRLHDLLIDKTPQGIKDLWFRLQNVRSRAETIMPALQQRIAEGDDLLRAMAQTEFELEDFERQRQEITALENLVNFAEENRLTVERTLDTIQEKVSEQINAIDQQTYDLATQVNERIRPFTDISAWFSTGFQLSGEWQKKAYFEVDYLFNLADPRGQLAYEHMLSSRLKLATSQALTRKWEINQHPLFDLSTAEAVWSETKNSEDPPVIQVQRLNIKSKEKSLALNVHFAGVNWGIKNQDIENKTSYRKDGEEFHYGIRAHKFSKYLTLPLFDLAESTSKTSGLIIPLSAEGRTLNEGHYWYRWQHSYLKSHSMPLKEAIHNAYNILGPWAYNLRLNEQYYGEFPGQVRADLHVLLDSKSFKNFFDFRVNSVEILWDAMAAISKSFDNTYGVPVINFGVFSGDNTYADWLLPETPKVQEAGGFRPFLVQRCEDIRQVFGNKFCRWFRDEFSYGWIMAASSPDPERRLRFLEKMFEKKWLANTVMADLMMRIFLEVTWRLNPNPDGMEAAIAFKVHNSEAADVRASPQVSFNPHPLDSLVVAVSDQ